MVVDTNKENLCINKLIATKKEIIMVEGDVIVPDSKPDILSTICTSGVACIYRKEVLEEKVKIDGNINTYIMYLADDEKDRVRGINTNLDFSENINIKGAKEGMECKICVKTKSIEAKVINGRKVSLKASLELDIKVYSREEMEIINKVQNCENLQVLEKSIKVNSLIGTGETKIYAKDTLSIDNIDNLAEILKVSVQICDKDIKVSYNKILTKAEAEVKIMYLTEDNRINSVNGKIPIVGFIDIANVSEENISEVEYEIKNLIVKPNSNEEHSIYVEMEVGVFATVYEEKQINLIEDLYSPSEVIDFNKKQITTITDMQNRKEMNKVIEKVKVENLENRNILDVDITPVINNQSNFNSKIMYEGELEIKFIISNSELQVDTRMVKVPFQYELNNLEDGENLNADLNIDIKNKDFVIQDEGNITVNADMEMESNLYRNLNLNILDEIQTAGEREEQDYNIVIYIVKKGDTLWNIAKRFGSTVDDIVRTNGIEDPDNIQIGQKIYIPKYSRVMKKVNYA